MACRAEVSCQSVSCAETTIISVSSFVQAVKPLQFMLRPEEDSPNHIMSYPGMTTISGYSRLLS